MLYHYLINGDRLTIGKFNSIACGAKFLFTSANHALGADYEHFIRNPRNLSVFSAKIKMLRFLTGY